MSSIALPVDHYPVDVASVRVPTDQELQVHKDVLFFDHHGLPISETPDMAAFNSRCQHAVKEAAWREVNGVPRPYLYADPLDHVRLGDRVRTTDPRIVYFIGVTRSTAVIMVSRLLLALYHHSHLYLLHMDLKAAEAVPEDLLRLVREHPNIHVMRTRRLVQWGAWTMVLTLLDAMHTVVEARVDFDFVINLSDVDVALRTNDEIVEFLRPHKGRQFVQVHQGEGEWLEKARNFTSSHVVVECGGYGFVAINSSVVDLGGGPQCCFGRGGPVVYVNSSTLHLREARHAVRDEAENKSRLHTGSQWVILDRTFVTYIVTDARAAAWMRVFEHRFLSDESFIQTVLMHSPYRSTLINHNMRYIYWPHYDGDPTSYWVRMGPSYVGGPQVINSTNAPKVFRSPYMFARKFDPTVDAEAVRLWDAWMAHKLKGGRHADQDALGGTPRSSHDWHEPMERAARLGGAFGADDITTDPNVKYARLARKLNRRVKRITFEDGSTCDCSPTCGAVGSCCDDWPELCNEGHASAGSGDSDPLAESNELLPPCPLPTHIESSAAVGSKIQLTFLNHARYPVRLYHVLDSSQGRAEREMGSLQPYGSALTFDTRDSHAWLARTWSGVVILEVPPLEGRRSSTIDVHECALHAPRRGLHHGWS